MRIKKNFFCRVALYGLILFGFSNPVLGQGNINVSAGIGLPELINIGARYQIYQVQIGVGFGSWPPFSGTNSLYCFFGDVLFHFYGESSELSNRKPWYMRMEVNYQREESDTYIHKYLFLGMQVGREFNISKHLGVEMEVGLFGEASHQRIKKKEANPGWFSGFEFDFPILILPSIGIAAFYRI